MALKEKFFAMLEKLAPQERQQLKSFLDGSDTTAEQSNDVRPEIAEVPEETAAKSDEVVEEKTAADTETEKLTEDVPEKEAEIEGTDDEVLDEETAVEEPIFQKSEDAAPEAEQPTESEQTERPTDEQGETVPVDFQQIIDGLNAKIIALETENSALKAKTEGAFGLTSRTGELVKNNPLYDDDTSEIHFKK